MTSTPPSVSVVLVAALDEEGTIGQGGQLPWNLPDDLARFKQFTMGHALLMGRKTYESIGRALPGRVSLVLTRNPSQLEPHERVVPVASLDEALAWVANEAASAGLSTDTLMVVGGGEVYALTLPHATRLHLSRVQTRVGGDVSFPAIDPFAWQLERSARHPADDRNEYAVTCEEFVRRT